MSDILVHACIHATRNHSGTLTPRAMNPPTVQGKKATVVGGARSGRAVAQLLAERGAAVFLTERGPATRGLPDSLDDAGIAYEFEGHTTRAFDADFVAISPGVPTQSNVVRQARRAGLPIYSEIEVASWFCDAPIVAITGTNGKTTTTSLAGHVFRTAWADDSDRSVIVAGNIGYPFSDYVRDARPSDLVVLEVSSFQLDHVDTFHPRVSVVLNITPDHLNRYDHDFNAYAQAKFNIFQNQEEGDIVVYNHDDRFVREYMMHQQQTRTFRAMGISRSTAVDAGGFVHDDAFVLRMGDATDDASLMPTDALSLPGPHNQYNALAVAVAARAQGVSRDAIREGLSTFDGVPHRLESVRTVRGVEYVNDSKATNVRAVWYALRSFDRPLVLIAGGRDKGNDYAELTPLVREHVRAVVALGESADTVYRELGAAACNRVRARSMEDALETARDAAAPGDVVLLSPACASFDMYESYEERGDTFRRLVNNL